LPALKIDNDRPVGCPLPPGPIVDASHANNGWIDLGLGAPLHMSQDRGITQRAKAAHQSFCGAAASAMPENPNDAGQTRSSASEWPGQPGRRSVNAFHTDHYGIASASIALEPIPGFLAPEDPGTSANTNYAATITECRSPDIVHDPFHSPKWSNRRRSARSH